MSAAPKPSRPPTDAGEVAAIVRGKLVMQQLRALGMTDEEILNDEPTEIPHEAVTAWLEGRAPCPFP